MRLRLEHKVRRAIAILILLVLACAAICTGINLYMVTHEKKRILPHEKAAGLGDIDCVLVLGCKVREDGKLSGMLQDRVDVGIDLFDAGTSDRLLMTGDHGTVDYDEVNAMKAAAVEHGIDPECIFCDHAGFSTYESMYRARDIFGVKRVVIVSQGYHLYRALYIAEKLGLEAWGVSATLRRYGGEKRFEAREFLARVKDTAYCIFNPLPTYLGEQIPITGSGSLTDG